MKANRLIAVALLGLATLAPQLVTAYAQGTAFTYQGQLKEGANPAHGSYDLTFSLFTAITGGSALAGPLTYNAVPVSHGLFTLTLDFGIGVFDGANRWLEIGVRPSGVGDYTTLSPRQPLTPTPYAIAAGRVTGPIHGSSILGGTIASAQLAPGAVTAASIASNTITAGQLATGAAAANLNASGQSGVAGGGMILSTDPQATSLLDAGYVKVGSMLVDGQVGTANWQRGYAAAGTPDGRRDHSAVWTGTEMIVWGGTVTGGSAAGGGWRYSPVTDSWRPVASVSAPSARYGHTAVWLAGRMIVWGGRIGATDTQTGGSYDPVTDSWTAISTNAAPTPRSYQTAVAAGTAMLVWGGGSGTNRLNDGARYQPATDTWLPMSANHSLAGRVGHSAVWTGNEMIVWGGMTNQYATDRVNDGGRYSPAADTWVAIPSPDAAVPRSGHTAVWTGREMVIWGGLGTNSNSLNTGARYDPANQVWSVTTTTNAPGGRYGHTAVWTGDEMIIWGGYQALNSGGRYSPATDTWLPTTTSSAPDGRYAHTAVWTDAEMLVWGGFGSTAATALNSGARYRPDLDAWNPTFRVVPTPVPRFGHAAVWTGSEMIVIGGSDQDRYGGRYNPTTDSWTAMPPSPGRHGEGCTALWTGAELILWGGEGSPSDGTGDRYNPATGNWTRTAEFPSTFRVQGSRMDHSAVWTGSEMIIWGGRRDRFTALGNGFVYHLASNVWSLIGAPPGPGSPGPFPRFGHTAVWTGAEMLVWGGYTDADRRACTNGGFRYPGLSALTGAGTAPSARAFHTAVWTGTEMIIWGGQGFDLQTGRVICDPAGGRYSLLLDAWITLGTNGAPLSPGRYSNGRSRHTAVWTGREMIVWGGVNDRALDLDVGGEALDSGGQYNPATGLWALTDMVNAPSPRSRHTAVWTGDLMLVFGGDGARASYHALYYYSLSRTLYLYLKP